MYVCKLLLKAAKIKLFLSSAETVLGGKISVWIKRNN